MTPYAAVEVRNASGKLVYSHAADSGPPIRVLPADKVAEMNEIMTHVVTEGTGRAAQIPGLVISGKTGTTNNSTNAWFNAFTGNLVGSVWFGNDDNAPMENLTGGILPAMTWREIMVFAHRGLEPKPPFGVAPPPVVQTSPAAQAPAKAAPPTPAPRLPSSRSRRRRPAQSSIFANLRGPRSPDCRFRSDLALIPGRRPLVPAVSLGAVGSP